MTPTASHAKIFGPKAPVGRCLSRVNVKRQKNSLGNVTTELFCSFLVVQSRSDSAAVAGVSARSRSLCYNVSH